MDQQGQGQNQGQITVSRGVGWRVLLAHSTIPVMPNPIIGAPYPGLVGAPAMAAQPVGTFPVQNPPMQFQSQQPQQLQQKLLAFWASQCREMETASDLHSYDLPLARVKKIMKADGDVSAVSYESTILIAKACELFIKELATRTWYETEVQNRKVIQKSAFSQAMHKTDIYDFLVDIIPNGERKNKASRSSSSGAVLGWPVMDQASVGNRGVVTGWPTSDPVQSDLRSQPSDFGAPAQPQAPEGQEAPSNA